MKKELQNKLSRYTAAAAAVVAATSATAQITYTDVNPDYSVDDDQDANGFTAVALDLNNDATPDFILASRDTVTASHVRFTLVAPYGSAGNAIAGENPARRSRLALHLRAMRCGHCLVWRLHFRMQRLRQRQHLRPRSLQQVKQASSSSSSS